MVQGIADLELFSQEVLVKSIAAVFRLKALQCPETPAAVNAEDIAESSLRTMDELECREAFLRGKIRGAEKSGTVFHSCVS